MTAQPPLLLGGPDGALRWLIEQWDGDRAALEAVLFRLGRWAPLVLVELWPERTLIPEAMAPTLTELWAVGEEVDQAMWTAWRTLFERTGYLWDGEVAPRPLRPVRLYRGAIPAASRNVRWTDDLSVATAFADNRRDEHGQPGRVWTARVEPQRLYLRADIVLGPFPSLDPAQRQGRMTEFVVDTRGLAIEETVRAEVLPAWAAGRDRLRAGSNLVGRLRDGLAGLIADAP